MQKKTFEIPFSPPDITELEIKMVTEALQSGWITTGPRVKLLEKKLAEWLGVKKCVCLNSQTACAELALRILGVGKGDEVILPAYTYTATASVVCHVGAKPVMVDSQKDGLEMDYDAVEKAITKRTKAIIPVDIAGIPCDYERIFDILERKRKLFKPKTNIQSKIGRIAVVADGAHSLGAVRKGKMVGGIADFTNFSFHAVKNFTTAEGGAMTWRSIKGVDDEEVYRQVQLYSLHGQSKDALSKMKVGAWEYDIVGTWYKCNMTDIAAGMGLAQLERYPAMLARRKEIIQKYDDAFKPLGIETLAHYTDEYSSSGHLYITQVPNIGDKERREIIEMMAERGIACNVHYKPLPMHTAYKKLGFSIIKYPNAYAHYEREITLPLHTKLTDEEINYVIACYTECVQKYLK